MTFYILAPANYTSGGPELAHQLCYTVNKNTNYKAYMCYANLFDRNWIEGIPFDANAPESYSGYCTEHVVSLDEMDS
ncbi:MAG: hypothetical protein IJ719_13060, partial [Clostridia bacterium]|nr:hypothetical protein [Clostridia bacterium]